MARGNQNALLTERAAFREDSFLQGAGDRAGMKETYRSRQERTEVWDPHMQIFYHFCLFRSKTKSKIFKCCLCISTNPYHY